MVGSQIRFLFTLELLQAHSFACNNSLVNKNRMRSATISNLYIILEQLVLTVQFGYSW